MAKKRAKIEEIQGMISIISISEIESLEIEPLLELHKICEGIEDKRFQPYVEHLLADIVLIVLAAVLSGADGWSQIGVFARSKEAWFRKFLVLPNGMPSIDTIKRVISAIDGDVLFSLTANFLKDKLVKPAGTAEMVNNSEGAVRSGAAGTDRFQEAERGPEIIAVDGKTSRGSGRKKTGRDALKAIHTVSAYSTEYGMAFSERVVEEKTNEIPAVQAMLLSTNLEGAIVTWDAINTQRETVRIVRKRKGDYIGALKENQKGFYGDVKLYFDDRTLAEFSQDRAKYARTVDKEQSGVAVREYFLTQDILWIDYRKEWAGLKSIGCARRTLKKFSGEIIIETRYFIASISEIEYFARGVRSHWQVENKLHWHLDYTFRDDQNTTTEKHGARNLQTMKRVSLSILSIVRQLFPKHSLKNIRFKLSLEFESNIELIFKILNVDSLKPLLASQNSS